MKRFTIILESNKKGRTSNGAAFKSNLPSLSRASGSWSLTMNRIIDGLVSHVNTRFD